MGAERASEPLLEHLLLHEEEDENRKVLLHPDCPGCKASHLREKNAKAPYKLLFYMGCIVLCNALPISVLYPFLYFMVNDFHIAEPEKIGYYAGWLGSSFMIGRFCTGILWGTISDKYGRKPVMIFGLISVLVFNTLFGLSTTFWMAIVTRFLLGSFNGMLGTVKAYASEICNEEHQALGVSTVGTTWGLGLIIGPAIGGYLAQPAEKYPHLFHKGSLFERYPYLLQAIFVSSFSLLGLAMVSHLPETLHKHGKPEIGLESDLNDKLSVVISEGDEKQQPKSEESLFRNWPLIASTSVYCLWSLHDIAYTEIFSLWAVSPKSYGGLNFSSSDVGQVLAVSGFAMLFSQTFLFAPLCNLVGPSNITRASALLTIPLLAGYPYLCKLEGGLLMSIVLIAGVIKYVLTIAAMTGSFILINNSVKQHQRGAANGFSLSAVSLFKAIGPAGGGSVFAWTQTRLHSWFLPGDQMVFFFLNVFAFLTFITSFEPFLPQSVNKPIPEDEEESNE